MSGQNLLTIKFRSRIFPVLIFMGLFYLFFAFFLGATVSSAPPEMRIGISFSGDYVEVSYAADYRLVNEATGAALPLSPGRYRFVSAAPGIQVLNECGQSQGVFQGPLYLEPLSSQPANLSFTLENGLYGKGYRGGLEIIKEHDSLLAVNLLDLESYLRGVVPREMPAFWGNSGGLEALKAQAVAARNYALYHLGAPKQEHFHLCDTQSSQVYGGKGAEMALTNSAVAQTGGEVLLYNNKVVQLFYHATNGGHTELAQNVWQNAVPYLVSAPDPYDDPANPLNLGNMVIHNRAVWEVDLPVNGLPALLAEKGYSALGPIKQIKVTSTFGSGRVEELSLVGTRGTLSLLKEKARTALGLNSQLFTVQSEPQPRVWVASSLNGLEQKESFSGLKGRWVLSGQAARRTLGDGDFMARGAQVKSLVPYQAFLLKGYGWGHGLGMSQNGAYNRARAGQSYREILSFYYPGTELTASY